MAKAARTLQLAELFKTHLTETEGHVERLDECLQTLGAPARAKPCKGMAGLIEEGEGLSLKARRSKMPALTLD